MRRTALLLIAAVAAPLAAGDAPPPPGATLLVIPNTHLDTQWMWTAGDTIASHLPRTLAGNAALFADHPGYRFAFEQAIHHRWIDELWPERGAWLAEQVRAGGWHPTGGVVVAGDVAIPSPETLIRQHLLGVRWFQARYGVRNRAAFLPDCFGYPASFPAVLAHCGFTGLITGKVNRTWAGYDPPFHIGRWAGSDGREVLLVAMDKYGHAWREPPGSNAKQAQGWFRGMAADRIPLAVRTVGRGDDGGAPDEASVRHVLAAAAAGGATLAVVVADPDQVVARIAAAGADLRRHDGDLLLRRHGTGSLTSMAAAKRLDRLAGEALLAAETWSVVAAQATGLAMPVRELREAWWRMLWHQFHDDLPGTSIAPAYLHTWDDLYAAATEADAISRGALAALAAAADTTGPGIPVLVANPLTTARREAVELTVPWAGPFPAVLAVVDGAGDPVPAQPTGLRDGRLSLVAVPAVPALGFTVLRVAAAEAPAPAPAVAAGPRHLANRRLRVEVDGAGRIAAITGADGTPWLAAPAGPQLLRDDPEDWPAWEVDADDLAAPPLPWDEVRVELVEQGPARSVLAVEHRAEGVRVTTRIALAADDDAVELDIAIDWFRQGALLKYAVPFAIDPDTTWDDGGVLPIPRGRNRPEQDEVPHQQWTGLSDGDGRRFAVLNDGRCGRDRPAGGTLRVSLVRTPAVHDRVNGFPVLAMQDIGRHRVRLALAAGRGGDWPGSGIPQRAAALNRPLQAVVPARTGAGPLGRRWSWLAAPSPVPASALKPAEDGDGVVVRWMGGGPGPVPARAPLADIALDGIEEPAAARGAITTRRWRLPAPPLSPVRAEPVALAPDLVGVADGAAPGSADLTGRGEAYLASVWPAVVRCDGVDFPLTAPAPGRPTLRRWRGTLALPRPARDGEALWLLAAADGARTVSAIAAGSVLATEVPDWLRPLGRWWSPVVPGRPVFDQPPQPVSDAKPGWVPAADARPAAVLPHTVRWSGVQPLRHGHLALVRLPLPPGAERIDLQTAPAWIAAAALVAGPPPAAPATTLRWP